MDGEKFEIDQFMIYGIHVTWFLLVRWLKCYPLILTESIYNTYQSKKPNQ